MGFHHLFYEVEELVKRQFFFSEISIQERGHGPVMVRHGGEMVVVKAFKWGNRGELTR
jgi:hypothetical protein